METGQAIRIRLAELVNVLQKKLIVRAAHKTAIPFVL